MINALGRQIAALLVAAVLVASCSGPKANLPMNPANFAPPSEAANTGPGQPYRLGVLDKVRVNVFRIPDLSGEFQVDTLGEISLPLIGAVQASGLTARQLESALESRYGERYLQQPDISVQLTQITGSLVTVEGSVKQPTVFDLVGEINLLQAIARANGTDEFANNHRVVVFRRQEGVTQAAAFDLAKVRAGVDPNPTIYGGDIIVVDGSGFKRAYRDLLQTIPLIAVFRPFG